MATPRATPSATPTRTQANFFRKSKTKGSLAQHHHVARARKAKLSTKHSLEVLNADRHCSPGLAPSSGFDGYQPGMGLDDAERTHMESGDESDSIDGENLYIVSSSVMSPNHVLSLGSSPSTMGASKFYSTCQPQRSRHQSGYYRSTDEALVALLQSQQASLEKVCKHWHVNIHTTVPVFYLQMVESQRKLEDWKKNIEETLLKLESKVAHHSFTSPTPSSSSTESPSDKKRKRFVTRTLSVSLHSLVSNTIVQHSLVYYLYTPKYDGVMHAVIMHCFLQSKVYSVHEESPNKFNSSEVYVIHERSAIKYHFTMCLCAIYFRLSSGHNRRVQAEILNELLSHPDSKFPEENVKSEQGYCVNPAFL